MIAEFGLAALWLAAALAGLQLLGGFAGLRAGGEGLAALVRPAAVVQALLCALAFGALLLLFVRTDLSVALVAKNSHSAKPFIFKLAGAWGNHEGSMLLWVAVMALAGGLIAAVERRLPERTMLATLGAQAFVGLGFYAFLLASSNPFERLAQPPAEGMGLNPLLQDIGLALHPPTLYMGYVGLSVAFSFAVGALLTRQVTPDFAKVMRPWVLGAWIFLTLGITAGSYWAYYELGWGGWWFWDPVENASLMPWLAATALLHSASVLASRDALRTWTLLLGVVAFSMSMVGTFLVRSGILTSVHTFASDPTRGLVILALLALVIGGAFALFAFRAAALRQGGLFAPVSREGALILNNLFLATAVGAVLVGTLYPLLLDALTGTTISVGAPFFDLTFGALMAPLLLVLPFGPLLAWKRADIVGAAQRLMGAAALAIFATILISALGGVTISLAPIGLLLGFWVAFGAVAELVDRSKLGRIPLGESARRLIGLPRTAWSTAIAHFGIGITVLGIVAVSAWETELVTTLNPGESAELSGYIIAFDSFEQVPGPNYLSDEGHFTVTAPDGGTRQMMADRRTYVASGMPTTEAAIETYGFSQLYLQLGEPLDNTHVVRIWHKPYITLIWLGAILMAFAGVLSLTDRKLRVGAPRRAAKTTPQAAQ